jgi:hypothetical protein
MARDASLTKAIEVEKRFSCVPRMPADQRELIRRYYPEGIRGKPLGKLSGRTLYRISERLFWYAHALLRKLSGQERECVKTLWALEGSMRSLSKHLWEDLDERACIQLESLAADSAVVAEYARIKGPKKEVDGGAHARIEG